MTNLPSEQVRDEASVWVARLDRQLTPAEVDDLQGWLNQSEDHRDALFELAALWDDLCVLNQLSSLFPFDPASLDLHTRNKRQPIMALAASLLVMLAAGFWWNSENTQKLAPGTFISHTVSHKTKVGENRVVNLSDGSSVHLNTNSRIDVTFNHQQRHIELTRGEARFSVAKDSERPFIVQAGDSSVRALGTVFNVELTENLVEVLVTEGRVLVTRAELPAAEQVTIAPGQWTKVDKQGIQAALSMPLEQVQKELAWRDGMVIFRGEPLDEALEEIRRYTNKPLLVADEQAGALKIAGFFKAGDVDGLLLSLSENFPLTFEEKNGVIVIASSTPNTVKD